MIVIIKGKSACDSCRFSITLFSQVEKREVEILSRLDCHYEVMTIVSRRLSSLKDSFRSI